MMQQLIISCHEVVKKGENEISIEWMKVKRSEMKEMSPTALNVVRCRAKHGVGERHSARNGTVAFVFFSQSTHAHTSRAGSEQL